MIPRVGDRVRVVLRRPPFEGKLGVVTRVSYHGLDVKMDDDDFSAPIFWLFTSVECLNGLDVFLEMI